MASAAGSGDELGGTNPSVNSDPTEPISEVNVDVDQQSTSNTSSEASDKNVANIGRNALHDYQAESSPIRQMGNNSRPTRKVQLSVKGLESKISEMSLYLGRKINSHFRHLRGLKHSVGNVSLDEMIVLCDETNEHAANIDSIYHELSDLCEHKVNEQIKAIYDNYCFTVSAFVESMETQINELEDKKLKEVEEAIEQNNQDFREEAKLFSQLMEEMRENPLQPPVIVVQGNQPTGHTSATITTKEPEPRPNTNVESATSVLTKQRSTRDMTTARPSRVSLHSSNDNTAPTKFLPHQADQSSEGKQPPTGPTANQSNEVNLMQQLVQSLTMAIGNNKKSVEPGQFDGSNVLEFTDWEVDLDTYLRNEGIQGAERLRHLKKYAAGEARKCIEGYLSTNTNQAYLDARNTLKERYGNERQIVRNFRTKLANWSKVSAKDAKGLLEYSDFLGHLQSAMKSFRKLAILDDEEENEKMVQKLPEWLRIKWSRVVAKAEFAGEDYPDFQEFTRFLKEEAHIMNLPISRSVICSNDKPKERNSTQARTVKSYLSSNQSEKCLCCSLDNHTTTNCYRLQEKQKTDKEDFVKKNGLCFKCIQPGHRSKACDKKLKCLICKKSHATANHDQNWRENREKQRQNNQTANKQDEQIANKTQNKSTTETANSKQQNQQSQETSTKQDGFKRLNCQAASFKSHLTSMAIPVYISAGTGREMLVYALLDNMSDACYVSKEVISTLKPRISEIEKGITIHTINGPKTEDVERYDDFILRGYMTDSYAHVSAYQRDDIYCNRDQLPSPVKARRLEHLRPIADKMPPLMDIPVGLLIGMDVPEIIQPLETKPAASGRIGEAFGVKTLFGWTMCGGTMSASKTTRKKTVYKVDTTKETELLNILEQDFRDVEGDTFISQNDLKFLRMLEASTKQDALGNYVMPLPFKCEPTLPNNRDQAEKRFQNLLKQFKSDSTYYEEYNKFMMDLIKAGHAEEASAEPIKEGNVWYMPHFSVRHKQKGKLRVVFDASAKFEGIAINDLLLSGPDQMNSLLGILLRFRKEPVAISCDIQQMFYNFKVTAEHKDYFRFLWIKDMKSPEITEFRMNVHLFGAKSSPGVATFGLRKLADDHQDISAHATRFLKEDFYVDDGVTSVSTSQQAIKLIQDATKICAKGNVRLHKFQSNNKEVLAAVPESERGESTRLINIFEDQLPSERTLGMEWCLDTDTFNFTVPKSANKPATKRGILSTVAQVYDPMGLVSPFVLKGKQILQEVMAEQNSWDQLVTPENRQEWVEWTTDLINLSQVQLPRCFKPTANVIAIELHHFSDASLLGYGACSYIRQKTDQGVINSNLILAKARIAPLKKLTIPRLELQGAVTAVRLANTLRKELKMNIDKETFWTDSEIVLSYIANDCKRFHVYVANRVSEIKQSTTVDQWNYVSSRENPADIASRGATAKQLKGNALWFEGPHFLKKDITKYIEENQIERSIQIDDPEVRKPKLITLATSAAPNIIQRFAKYSNYEKLVRSLTILRIYARQKNWKKPQLTPQDLEATADFILLSVQTASYPRMEKEKSLAKLNPYIDGKGIMRIGGRIQNATHLTELEKHPATIPKNSHLSYLICKHHHEKTCHMGPRSTLAAIREAGFWIISGMTQVKSLIRQCVDCRKLRRKPEDQLMGNLPHERLEQTPPFTHIGMDAFGPFYVKDKRTEQKRWGLLLTCLYSRAIHIETLEDMSTDCLIQALRRFMAIRGPVKTIICDNGTNFVGMKNELYKQLGLASNDLKQYLLLNRIEFKFNSPNASHQGGVTERLIRSVRAVLNSMALKLKNRLDTKTLTTAFYEAASIVNNRPLTATSINNPEENIVTPNKLITMKTAPLVALPPGEFPDDTLYSTKRWKISQKIAEDFWLAWKTEYLNDISVRQKWTVAKDNVKVGDIVLLKEENTARNTWKVGCVKSVMPGNDGLVRNLEIRLGNRHIDRNGKPLQPPTTLIRPIQSIVILLKV